MLIQWRKCILQSKCRLNSLNLNNEHFDSLVGVCVIYSEDKRLNNIFVGQGNIRDILTDMKKDKKLQKYGPDLFVTWAYVPLSSLKGVEAFLNKELNPIIQNLNKGVELINVNLP